MPVIPCTVVKVASVARRVAVARPRPTLAAAGAAVVRPRPRSVARVCRDAGALGLAGTVPTATPADAPVATGADALPTAAQPGQAFAGLDSVAGVAGGAPGGATGPAAQPGTFQIAGPLLFTHPGPGPIPPGPDTPGCCGTHVPDVPPPIPPTDIPAPALGAAFALGAVLLLSLRWMRRRG